MKSPWTKMDRELEILKHSDALGVLGFYNALKKEGLKDDDSIPVESRKRFYQVTPGHRAAHLVVSNNLSQTVTPEVIDQFNELFQNGIKAATAAITDDDELDSLRSKWKEGDFHPGEDMITSNLLLEAAFWYRARQLRDNRPEITHEAVFNTVRGELTILKKDIKFFIDAVVGSSMMSFAMFLEEGGYRPMEASAISINIVTLHTHAGVIVAPLTIDAEKMRDIDNKREKIEKSPSHKFDPSYM